jgi:hypothetical protein
MAEIFFFFAADDPSVAVEALRLGNFLLVNKDYGPDEDLIFVSAASNVDACSFQRFFILPDDADVSEISLGDGTKKGGRKFRYIKDRIGAAAIDLILSSKPSEGEVCVGSLAFQARTYPSENEPLELRPLVFSKVFQSLRSYIKQSAEPVSNGKTPKTVYVFPKALELLRQNPSRSPWLSLRVTK